MAQKELWSLSLVLFQSVDLKFECMTYIFSAPLRRTLQFEHFAVRKLCCAKCFAVSGPLRIVQMCLFSLNMAVFATILLCQNPFSVPEVANSPLFSIPVA